MAEDVTRGEEWSNLCYFCFLCAKKSILVASQTEVEPLMSHGLFKPVVFTTFLDLEHFSCVAVYGGSDSSQI